MLAVAVGILSFLVGLGVMFLPILVTEISRPRDLIWGGVFLFLGLVLVTNSDRLRGAPMLAVFFGTSLIVRLLFEVAQGRWQQLSQDEQNRFGTIERWNTGFGELMQSVIEFGAVSRGFFKFSDFRSKTKQTGKKWVRSEAVEPQLSEEESQTASRNVPIEDVESSSGKLIAHDDLGK